jgi:oligoendopeptidase F
MEREEALDKYKWDLKDIYSSQQDWEKDYEELMANVSRYEDYKGKLNTEETLKEYMDFNEWFSRKFMKLYLYSYLGHDIALKDDTCQTNLDKIQNLQLFSV